MNPGIIILVIVIIFALAGLAFYIYTSEPTKAADTSTSASTSEDLQLIRIGHANYPIRQWMGTPEDWAPYNDWINMWDFSAYKNKISGTDKYCIDNRKSPSRSFLHKDENCPGTGFYAYPQKQGGTYPICARNIFGRTILYDNEDCPGIPVSGEAGKTPAGTFWVPKITTPKLKTPKMTYITTAGNYGHFGD